MVAVFTAFGIDGRTDGAPLGPDAPREQRSRRRRGQGAAAAHFPAALPDVYAAAVRDVAGFARSLA